MNRDLALDDYSHSIYIAILEHADADCEAFYYDAAYCNCDDRRESIIEEFVNLNILKEIKIWSL